MAPGHKLWPLGAASLVSTLTPSEGLVARPHLERGTHGRVRVYPDPAGYRAVCLYRDWDGVTRQMQRQAKTRASMLVVRVDGGRTAERLVDRFASWVAPLVREGSRDVRGDRARREWLLTGPPARKWLGNPDEGAVGEDNPTGTELDRARLQSTKLRGADLRGASMDAVNWRAFDLTGVG